MRARGRVATAVWMAAALAASQASLAGAAAKPQGHVVEAAKLILDGRPAGAGSTLYRGQRLRLAPDGVAAFTVGEAAVKLSEGAQAQLLELGPKVKIALTAGSVLIAAGGTDVQVMTLHSVAMVRRGALFVNQGPATPTYVCACAGQISVSQTGGPLKEIAHPHHHAMLIDGLAVKLAPSDRHAGQDLFALLMDLGPGVGEPLRVALWDAITRPPGARRLPAVAELPDVPALPPPSAAAGSAAAGSAAAGRVISPGSGASAGAPGAGARATLGTSSGATGAAAGAGVGAVTGATIGTAAGAAGAAVGTAAGTAGSAAGTAVRSVGSGRVGSPGAATAGRTTGAAAGATAGAPGGGSRGLRSRTGAAPAPKKAEEPDLEQLFPDAIATDSETP